MLYDFSFKVFDYSKSDGVGQDAIFQFYVNECMKHFNLNFNGCMDTFLRTVLLMNRDTSDRQP